MSLDAIKTVSEAEQKAARIKAEALAQSKKDMAEAAEKSKDALDAAVKKAEAELKDLKRKADEKVTEQAGELARSTENKKAAMRVKAESRLDAASSLIVERIVNS